MVLGRRDAVTDGRARRRSELRAFCQRQTWRRWRPFPVRLPERFERLRGGIVSDVFRIGSRPAMPAERRRFMVALAGGLLAAPLAARAQQSPTTPRISVLEANPGFDRPFHDGLSQLGYVEGKNIAIEWRRAQARAERFPELAAELVPLKVEVIIATNDQAVAAARRRQPRRSPSSWWSLPILFASGSLPVSRVQPATSRG